MPPPVILPDRLDPMTRAQLAQVVEARDSGTPIRSYRSIEKICDVTEARAVTLWGIWREVSPFVFERHNPAPAPQDPVAIAVAVDQQAADEEQDHAAALASAEADTAPEEPTHADPIDSAPVRDVREPDHDRQHEGVDGHALVARPPDGAPGPAGGPADGLLPGLRAETGIGRPARGKGKAVTPIDDPRWHRCADALGRILAVHGGARALAAGIQPSGGRGKIIADTAPKSGWERYAARLEAVADACEGHPHALSTADRIHKALGDPTSQLTVEGLLWIRGAKLVGALDAALSQPEAADRVSDLRPVVRVATAAPQMGGRDAAVRSMRDRLIAEVERDRRERDIIDIEEVRHGN